MYPSCPPLAFSHHGYLHPLFTHLYLLSQLHPAPCVSPFSCCSLCYVVSWSIMCSISSTSLDHVYKKEQVSVEEFQDKLLSGVGDVGGQSWSEMAACAWICGCLTWVWKMIEGIKNMWGQLDAVLQHLCWTRKQQKYLWTPQGIIWKRMITAR